MDQMTTLLLENPFGNFTSRSDLPDLIDLPRPRMQVEERIIQYVEQTRHTKVPKIIPVLAEAGLGKTHLYWALKKRLGKTFIAYIPPPTDANRIMSHFYFHLLQAHGKDLIIAAADGLLQKYQTLENALYAHAGRGALIVEALFRLKTDPAMAKYLVRWLTGLTIDQESLKVERTILDDEEMALEGIKILLRESPYPVLFFVDELESLFISKGHEAEIKFLEGIKRLVNEAQNFVLILSCLNTMWDHILDLSSQAIQSRMETPSLLKRFTKEDIRTYAEIALEMFWKKYNIVPKEDDKLWPLKDADIEAAYATSHGNPREAIKYLQNKLEEKKLFILQEIAEYQRIRKNQAIIAKKIVEKIKNSYPKANAGVYSHGLGAFVFIFLNNKQYLIVLPPINTNAETQAEFKTQLKELLNNATNFIFLLDPANEFSEWVAPNLAVIHTNDENQILSTIITQINKDNAI